MQWHRLNIPVLKGKNRGIERNGTKVRLKARRANINSLVPCLAPKVGCGDM